jgi:hypothetical protein
MKAPPLFGIGSDDSHNYHEFSPQKANPGRAWIMVRARQLSANAIVDAISRGDFYASTGVVLRDVTYDAKTRTYKVAVRAEPGVHYTIEFIGTLQGADTAYQSIPASKGAKSDRPGRRYSPEVGKVLASRQGDAATYKLSGEELYVRAAVRSDKPMANPIGDDVVTEQAWCQPVGWER